MTTGLPGSNCQRRLAARHELSAGTARKTKSAASAAADFVTRKRGEENEKDNLESFVYIIKGKYEEKKGINIKTV